MAIATSWVGDLLEGYRLIDPGNSPAPKRNVLRLLGASITDNPGYTDANGNVVGSTDVVMPGSGGVSGQGSTAVANGLNSNVPTANQASLRLTGPSAAFSVGGFSVPGAATPITSAQLVVVNTTVQPMTLVHEDASSTAVYRIDTQSGVPITLPGGRRASAVFVYDGTTSRWILQNIGAAYPGPLNVRDYGVAGNGTTDDHATLTTAGASAAAYTSTGHELYYPPGTYHLGSNFTFAAGVTHVFSRGASFTAAGGVTSIVVAGQIVCAPDASPFAGLTVVTISPGATPWVYPDWWGGVNATLQNTVNAVGATGTLIRLRLATYTNANVAWSFANVKIEGDVVPDYYNTPAQNSSILSFTTATAGSSVAISVGSNPGPFVGGVGEASASPLVFTSGTTLRNFVLQCLTTTTVGLQLWMATNSIVERLRITGQQSVLCTAIFEQGGVNNKYSDILYDGTVVSKTSSSALGNGRQVIAAGTTYGGGAGSPSISTTSHEIKGYYQNCITAHTNNTSFSSLSECTFQSCAIAVSGLNATVVLHGGYVEGCGYGSNNTCTVNVDAGSRFRAFGTFWTFYSDAWQVAEVAASPGEQRIVLVGCEFSANTVGTPALFYPASAYTCTVDGCLFYSAGAAWTLDGTASLGRQARFHPGEITFTQSVSGGASVTAVLGAMIYVNATGGTCAVTPPALPPAGVPGAWGYCDVAPNTFTAAKGVAISNGGNTVEDPTITGGILTTATINDYTPGVVRIFSSDPTGTYWRAQ